MTLSLQTRVRATPHTMVQDLEGESVLLNLASEHYFGLDEVGTRMWLALTTADNVQAAHAALLSEYDVDADVLRHDLLDLIQQLVEHGLVALSAE
jgi:Coenzyme PQQ synthesis protein D (PqqD)